MPDSKFSIDNVISVVTGNLNESKIQVANFQADVVALEKLLEILKAVAEKEQETLNVVATR